MSNKQSDKLIFHDSPVVEFGGNAFQNVPVILQYEDKPLIEVVRVAQAGYEIQLSIYDKSGLYITKVKSSQAYRTEEAKRAGVALEHAVDATTCKWNGQTIFELKRSGPAAWRGWAEIYTPSGVLVKGTDTNLDTYNVDASGNQIRIGGVTFTGNVLYDLPVGLLVGVNGGVSIPGILGVGPSPAPIGDSRNRATATEIQEQAVRSLTRVAKEDPKSTSMTDEPKTFLVTIVPKGFREGEAADKELADRLQKLNEQERKSGALCRFDLPEAINGLKCETGPKPVQILFFAPTNEGEPENLKKRLLGYFPLDQWTM